MVKLLVNISNSDYESLFKIWDSFNENDSVGRMLKAIHDGTVLSDKVDKEYEKQETVLQDIKAEIKQWYWDADKQALANDPCVIDAMVDLFIRTIDKHMESKENEK